MPRVVDTYKEQARQKIIDVATKEFAKKGYRSVTMADIAKKVGVSKAAVYNYFDSKESLAGAISVSVVESALEDGLSRQGGRSFAEAVQGSFLRLLDALPGQLPSLASDLLAQAHHDGEARRISLRMERAIVEATAEFWKSRMKDGEIAPDLNTKSLHHALVALQLGLLMEISAGIPRQQAIDAWNEVVSRLVAPREPRKT